MAQIFAIQEKDKEMNKVDAKMEETFHRRVIGQGEAVKAISCAIQRVPPEAMVLKRETRHNRG